MKRKLFTILCMLLPLVASAQILKDSTINTVAYWNLGDKFKYLHETREYTVENNDTIWGDAMNEVFTLEVVDSTATGYVLKYQTQDCVYEYENKEQQAMMDPIMKKYMDVPLYVATNEYGTFTGLAYWEKTQVVIDSIVNDIKKSMDDFYEQQPDSLKLNKEEKEQYEAMMENLYNAFRTKEMNTQNVAFLADLLYYHGTNMAQNHEYTGKQQMSSLWMPGETIDVELTHQIIKVNYENNWVNFYRTQRYDAGQLVEQFMRFMQQSLPPEQAMAITPDDIPFLMVETVLDLDVHVGSGWPGETFFKKVVQVGPKKKVSTWYITMVFDEEE